MEGEIEKGALSPQQKKVLRAKARLIEPVLRIGKKGITQNVLKELDGHLKNRKLIKIKLVKGFFEDNDRRSAAQEIAKHTGAEIVDQIGFVIVLFRK